MRLARLALVAVCASVTLPAAAQQSAPLEYIGKPVRGVPVSQAVKVGKLLFVSGTPPFGKVGTDFGERFPSTDEVSD